MYSINHQHIFTLFSFIVVIIVYHYKKIVILFVPGRHHAGILGGRIFPMLGSPVGVYHILYAPPSNRLHTYAYPHRAEGCHSDQQYSQSYNICDYITVSGMLPFQFNCFTRSYA